MRRRSSTKRTRQGPEFNHAMIYVADVARSLEFYRDALGFLLIEEHPGGYARLRSPRGTTTIALHRVEGQGAAMDAAPGSLRLYFEVRQLDRFCGRLAEKGVRLDKPPADMPWGWRHAYLRDPDGHEISLYWAGRKRYSHGRSGSQGGRGR